MNEFIFMEKCTVFPLFIIFFCKWYGYILHIYSIFLHLYFPYLLIFAQMSYS